MNITESPSSVTRLAGGMVMVGAAGRYGEVISLEGFMCVVFFKLTISVPVMTTVIAENEKVK